MDRRLIIFVCLIGGMMTFKDKVTEFKEVPLVSNAYHIRAGSSFILAVDNHGYRIDNILLESCFSFRKIAVRNQKEIRFHYKTTCIPDNLPFNSIQFRVAAIVNDGEFRSELDKYYTIIIDNDSITNQ